MENCGTSNRKKKHGKLNPHKFKKSLVIFTVIFSIIAFIFCRKSIKKFIIILLIEETVYITLVLLMLRKQENKSRNTHSYQRVNKRQPKRKRNSRISSRSSKRDFDINIDDFVESKNSVRKIGEENYGKKREGKLIRYDFSKIKEGIDNIDNINIDINEEARSDGDKGLNNSDSDIIESRNVSVVKKGPMSSLDYFEGPRLVAPGWGLDFESEKSKSKGKSRDAVKLENETKVENEIIPEKEEHIEEEYKEEYIEKDEFEKPDEDKAVLQRIKNEEKEIGEIENGYNEYTYIDDQYTYTDEEPKNEPITQRENVFTDEEPTEYEDIQENVTKEYDETVKDEIPQISNELINQIIDKLAQENDVNDVFDETEDNHGTDEFSKDLIEFDEKKDNYNDFGGKDDNIIKSDFRECDYNADFEYNHTNKEFKHNEYIEPANESEPNYITKTNSLNIWETGNVNKSTTEDNYNFPPIELLDLPTNPNQENEIDPVTEQNAAKLIKTLASFGVGASMVNISIGPTVTRYELQPNTGVKVSKIVNLADDIALNLAATGVRIEAPIPGKAAVGIEIPNKEIKTVYLREVIETKSFYVNSSKLTFAVGKSITGKPVIADIARMPHLLIAGATGSGKSVCINTLITSILYKASPSEVKMLMIDPKVVELNVYNGIPHLLIPVVTDPKKAAAALNWAVQEMITRYGLFAECNVRDLKGYNEHLKLNKQPPLPQIVIIIDELADLMMVSPAEVEDSVCRLAQMARAAGIHLVIATQRPSVDVITGLIKANIPSRIAFAVSSHIDSRTILDMAGAEKLLGKGDMLFYPAGEPKPIRVQGAYISDKEVERIVNYIKSGSKCEYDESILDQINNPSEYKLTENEEDDELLPRAVEIVLDAGQASTSLLQRKLRIGYARAARIIDQMEAMNIVSGYENGKPRQVLITKSEWMQMMER